MYFTHNLPFDLRQRVEEEMTTTLQDAYAAAVKYHGKNKFTSQRQEGSSSKKNNSFYTKRDDAQEKVPKKADWHSSLTKEEKHKRKKEGRCFICGDKGHMSIMCPKRQPPKN
eukprot:Rmarinus@m.7910